MKFLAVTTGDADGIGLEVSCKSLFTIGPQKNVRFIIYRSLNCEKKQKKYLSLLDKKFDRVIISDPVSLLDFIKNSSADLKKRPSLLVDYATEDSAPAWVEHAAQLCTMRTFHGLTTAPLSKKLINDSGLSDMGHTEILKRITKSQDVYQAFIGKYFNVLLATSHIPLSRVADKIRQPDTLLRALTAANQLRLSLPKNQAKRPLALLGINPHAGEYGLLGNEESSLFAPFCKQQKIIGPLSPDAAFLKKNWSKYSVYIACYHDQGLIPFKTIHGQDSGVHVSIGLPFIRTSVDHGTAKDIFNKDIANAASMTEAIEFALSVIKKI